jgi:dienelactone hydrolase
LLAPDRLGFGGSERGRAEPSLASQAAALAAVLESEPGPPAVVVGHSLGGPIAARLAIDRPDLVAGLLLVAPSIDPAEERHRWYNIAGATVVVQWFLPIDWTVSNRELWPLKQELEAMLPLWAGVRCPTIVVQGLADDLVPPGNADFAELRLAPGKVRIDRYPGENHFILWKRPETVRKPLLDLLSGSGWPAPRETRHDPQHSLRYRRAAGRSRHDLPARGGRAPVLPAARRPRSDQRRSLEAARLAPAGMLIAVLVAWAGGAFVGVAVAALLSAPAPGTPWRSGRSNGARQRPVAMVRTRSGSWSRDDDLPACRGSCRPPGRAGARPG